MLRRFSSLTPWVDGASAVFRGFIFHFPADLSRSPRPSERSVADRAGKSISPKE
jgi:hypothetical protein